VGLDRTKESALGKLVPQMVVQGIFPWCFTPELYASKPDYIQALSDFVRGRPEQPVDAFIRESDAVMAHDAEAQLGKSARRRKSRSGATT
jgi:hypothetical protein